MEVNISLYTGSVAASNINDLVIAPDSLVLRFSSPYSLDNLKVTVRNGSKRKQYKVEKSLLDISEFVFPGKIEAEAVLVIRGNIVKRWEIMPIIVKELPEKLEIVDLLSDLEKRIEEVEKRTTVIM